jgi:hypothetical protein
VVLHARELAHQLGVLLQLLHRADHHLVHDLAAVAHQEAHRLAALHDDVARLDLRRLAAACVAPAPLARGPPWR